MQRPIRLVAIVAVTVALLATACGRSGSSDSGSSSGSGSNASSKCKDAKLEATEIGVTADTITVQAMADVGSALAPGLFQGNIDATKAWAQWVNDNGGLACRQVKVTTWDSKMDPTEAKNGLLQGCKDALALVGDNTLFNPDTSTVGNCVDKAGQPIGIPDFVGLAIDPNEACLPQTWNAQGVTEVCANTTFTGLREQQFAPGPFKWMAKEFAPDREFMMVAGDLPTTVQSGTMIIAQQQAAGIDVVASAKVSGRSDQAAFTPMLQSAKSANANTIYNGSNDAAMLKAQKEAKAQGVLGNYKWIGSVSIYNKMYTQGDPTVTNGTYAVLQQLPWQESDASEGLAAYIKYIGGEDKADSLGANSFMAGMAFKETIDAIVAAKGPNAITRASILEAQKATKSTFGGWIGSVPKGGQDVMPCFVIVQIQDGKWNRVYPTKVGELDCATPRGTYRLDPQAEATKIP